MVTKTTFIIICPICGKWVVDSDKCIGNVCGTDKIQQCIDKNNLCTKFNYSSKDCKCNPKDIIRMLVGQIINLKTEHGDKRYEKET